jgi:hypothetical protein
MNIAKGNARNLRTSSTHCESTLAACQNSVFFALCPLATLRHLPLAIVRNFHFMNLVILMT